MHSRIEMSAVRAKKASPLPATIAGGIALLAAAFSAVSLVAWSPEARAQTRVGVLECNVSGGVGFVITSNKALSCAYRGANGRVERYVGTIRKFGLDIGVTGPAKLVWTVFAPSRPGPGALTGEYAGASASASAGVGVGANALVGGAQRSINLQPVSVQAQTGVNLTAGVSSLFLQFMP
ncbi:MAG: DUF992 domain-containing protein [Beijerinckiaceae bacterium]